MRVEVAPKSRELTPRAPHLVRARVGSTRRRARDPPCYDCRFALSDDLSSVRRFCARTRAPVDEHVAAERDAMNRPIVLDGCFRGTPRQKALEMDL